MSRTVRRPKQQATFCQQLTVKTLCKPSWFQWSQPVFKHMPSKNFSTKLSARSWDSGVHVRFSSPPLAQTLWHHKIPSASFRKSSPPIWGSWWKLVWSRPSLQAHVINKTSSSGSFSFLLGWGSSVKAFIPRNYMDMTLLSPYITGKEQTAILGLWAVSRYFTETTTGRKAKTASRRAWEGQEDFSFVGMT